MTDMERDRIINSAFHLIATRGLDFTADDLAAQLGMSKRTLYKKIESKNQVIRLVIDRGRDSIKKKQKTIIEDYTLGPVEKLRKLLTVQPDGESLLSGKELNVLKKRYPEEHAYVQKLYEDDWQDFFSLMAKEMEEGKIRNIDPELFKNIYIAAVTTEMTGNSFLKNLQEITDILFYGIVAKE